MKNSFKFDEREIIEISRSAIIKLKRALQKEKEGKDSAFESNIENAIETVRIIDEYLNCKGE